MTAAFTLDPQLHKDTLPVVRLGLSRVLLLNDARFPWLVLVPQKPDLVELMDLDAADRAVLMEEIAAASHALQQVIRPEKLNVGAIGNKVRQLHIHVLGRFSHDAAWPEPVWGRGPAIPYKDDAARAFISALSAHLPSSPIS